MRCVTACSPGRARSEAAQANMLLLGAAFQQGVLPVAAESIERAIDLNGVAVAANLAAFNWGRRWVLDPADVERLANIHTEPSDFPVSVPVLDAGLAARFEALAVTAEARTVVAMLAADLIGHSSVRTAARFASIIERVASAVS